MKVVLTIAGSDSSGGAGIQADIKTITAHRLYAESVVTALTAQNTTGVFAVQEATPTFVGQQLDAVFSDIRPDAVKIGMVSSVGIIEIIAAKLREYAAQRVVLDPVMISTSGCRLLAPEAAAALTYQLFPLAAVVTPNLPEAESLAGRPVHDHELMLAAARAIATPTPGAVLVKGGHLAESADDLLLVDGGPVWLPSPHIDNPNTHGTGCTLSSAIACGLANGFDVLSAVRAAKTYVAGALSAGLDLGAGSGPLNHIFDL